MKAAVLKCTLKFFPYATMLTLPQDLATQSVNKAFGKSGLPQCIKLDNGPPFVHPGNRELPTLAALWWIGLGIEVILNAPACPQQNGMVEGLQGTCDRWSNLAACADVGAAQAAVSASVHFQRAIYRIPARGLRTRLELYPELQQPRRPYNPASFDMQRIWTYLARQVWVRQVKKNGSVSFWGQEVYVRAELAYQTVTITLDPHDHQWAIHTQDGRLVKNPKQVFFTQEAILFNAGVSKNEGTT